MDKARAMFYLNSYKIQASDEEERKNDSEGAEKTDNDESPILEFAAKNNFTTDFSSASN